MIFNIGDKVRYNGSICKHTSEEKEKLDEWLKILQMNRGEMILYGSFRLAEGVVEDKFVISDDSRLYLIRDSVRGRLYAGYESGLSPFSKQVVSSSSSENFIKWLACEN